MFRQKWIIILVILALGLMISGCTDNSSSEDGTVSEETVKNNVSVAEKALNAEMVGITESEVQDIEADIAEVETLINDMDQEENISVTEI